jgi:hypothetical protein
MCVKLFYFLRTYSASGKIMKTSIFAVALFAISTAGVAYADSSSPTNVDQSASATTMQWSPNANAKALTRAEVREQLDQAQKSGQIAYLRSLYKGR